MLLTFLSFIFVLGILIFIHELGHFIVAKRVGIRVDRFSLGFPPNIFAHKYGETTYCIGIIPLGGYVKMAGENPDDDTTGAPNEFMSKSVGRRAAVIFAGPFMNYVLSILLLVGVFYFTGEPVFDDNKVVISEVSPDGPAEAAGLLPDDEIISVEGHAVSRYDSVSSIIYTRIEKPVELAIVRGADTLDFNITTMKAEVTNIDGGVDTVGMIGVSLGQKLLGYDDYSVFEATQKGVIYAHFIVWETVKIVKRLVTRELSIKSVGGPVFILQESGRQARRGVSNLFVFMALLSVNLAVLNVLPIPILDGGHLVFLAVEKLKGSPLSVKARIIAQQVGLVILLGLILTVTYNDILRWLRGL